jgi:predicted nucleotidyltransferase
MMSRAENKPVFNDSLQVKTLRPEDIIGLKIQAFHNDPGNRYFVDVPDIQQLLTLHGQSMDMGLVREYFRLFKKENLLDEWLDNIK